MGRRVAGVLALLAAALAGCFTGQPERSLSRLGPAGLGGPSGILGENGQDGLT